jgi:tetratricopeptide (TPR) repeat protein
MLVQFPADETAKNWLRNGETLAPTPESFLNRSLALFQQGRYEDSITMARMALKLRPNYAEAWNNVGAAYNSMKRWNEAIQAEKQALAIKPDYALAKNNLALAQSNSR